MHVANYPTDNTLFTFPLHRPRVCECLCAEGVVCFTTPLAFQTIYLWSVTTLERSGSVLAESYPDKSGGAEDKHEKTFTGWQMLQPRFGQGTCRTQVCNVTCSVCRPIEMFKVLGKQRRVSTLEYHRLFNANSLHCRNQLTRIPRCKVGCITRIHWKYSVPSCQSINWSFLSVFGNAISLRSSDIIVIICTGTGVILSTCGGRFLLYYLPYSFTKTLKSMAKLKK
jgi:hypothetical protein